ncbi:hypothetical protein [Pseudomonas huanghezhanensis]|uniref:hypothetical protein n=1 Tax=Pseudomonas huanghezhanensis TaxID=3002903 RepID=UPI0022861DDE|nr:hypothetical protein [Pseudomonas sp. BSw22131]
MINLLTAGRKALIERLSTISVSSGYLTQAGANTRSGWFNEVIKDRSVAFPLIVVQKAKGLAPVAGPHALKVFSGFNVVGAVQAGIDDYEDAVEALEHDLLQCLMPTQGVLPGWLPRGISGITVGAPEIFPPAEGVTAATVLIPVHLHTIIQVQPNA